jgi:hypothetical protein
VFAASALSLVPVIQADDPPTEPEPAGIMINYFGFSYLGDDQYLIEGVLTAPNMSIVELQWGGVASGVDAPDPYGYFSIEVTSPSDNTVTVDAADGTNTAHAELIIGTTPPAI